MNRASILRKGVAVIGVMAAMVPLKTSAQDSGESYQNLGPYVGGALGYNQPDDQTFEFSGTSTDPTQPTVPLELPPVRNTGNAATNEYKGNLFYQAVVGYRFASGLRPEFEVSYRQNEADDIIEFGNPNRLLGTSVNSGADVENESTEDNVKLTGTSGMFNLWYDLLPSWRIHPYVGGGAGFMRFKLNKQPTNRLREGTALVADPDNPLPGPPVCLAQDCSGPRKADDAAYAYQLGGGLRWDMRDDITVGLDYRYLKTTEAKFYAFKDQQETHLDAEYETQSLMLSVNYFFALPVPPPPPAPVAVVPPVSICSDGQDNDGDGMVDFPADPGCSSAEDGDETDPPACSDGKDNDGDGLIDFPADKGCSAAEDNDEVDPCKTPAVGEVISLKGCGTGDVIVLRGVNFEFDKARLTVNARTILDHVAEELVAYPEITIELGGHTDAKGSDEYNQALSERRAAAVVSYLEGKGVAAERMTSVGYGESRPVADNETDEGRELNRRVELKILSGVAGAGVTAEVEAAPAPAADAMPADAAEPLAEPAPAEGPVEAVTP